MNDAPSMTPAWLHELTEEIDKCLKKLTTGKQDQLPALAQEREAIAEKVQGWSMSLANPQLPFAVRRSIEGEWAAATERQQAIEAELSGLQQQELLANNFVQPKQVLERLNNLEEVLNKGNPTRGNLELSMHIDRITCSKGGKVTVRICKLGIIPDVVDLLGPHSAESASERPATTIRQSRRRNKLRVTESSGAVDLRAQASFAADTQRFAGLGEEWFWVDEFSIPIRTSWSEVNAKVVFRRRQKSRLSYAKLASEFGVTRPTIAAAIRRYLEDHPDEHDGVILQGGGKRRPKFDLSEFCDEARELWNAGWSTEKLAKKFGCSSPTITKAIAFAYARNGLPMPTREEVRRDKWAVARKLLEQGKELNEIAATMNVSDATARHLLQESFAADKKAMPDLRRRKPA